MSRLRHRLGRLLQLLRAECADLDDLLASGGRIRALREAGYSLVETEGANFVFVRRDALAVRA